MLIYLIINYLQITHRGKHLGNGLVISPMGYYHALFLLSFDSSEPAKNLYWNSIR